MASKFPNPFEQFQSIFEDIQERIKIAVEKTPESLVELSRYGWYIDLGFDFAEPIELYERITKGDIDYVDNYFIKYYNDKLKQIEYELCENYPSRAHIFSESFNCYKKGKYYATISLLLTQADGICYGKTKKLFFINNKQLAKQKKYVPEVEEKIQRMSGGVIDLLLEPMKNSTVINDLTENISSYPVKLNRHAILHGMDTEYGTKVNCLKVISFVNYLNEMLEDSSIS